MKTPPRRGTRFSYRMSLSGRDTALRPLRLALEEQHLADHRGNRGGLEGLCNQEGRLPPLAGEEALRMGGDEDHGPFEGLEQFVHRVETGTAVGELDIGEN